LVSSALLSFPTRRSSDLPRGKRRFVNATRPCKKFLQSPPWLRRRKVSPGDEAHGHRTKYGFHLLQFVILCLGQHQEGATLVVKGDRKSTRLNSSHVKISY